PKHSEEHQQRSDICGAECSAPEKPHGEHGGRAAQLPDHEHRQEDGAGGEGERAVAPSPAETVAADEAKDHAEQPGAGQNGPGEVEPTSRAVAFGQATTGHRNERDAERYVNPEDPLPGDIVDDGTADD